MIAAKLKDAPRQGFGSTVERDDFIPPATMTINTVLPGDKTEMLSAAVRVHACVPSDTRDDIPDRTDFGSDFLLWTKWSALKDNGINGEVGSMEARVSTEGLRTYQEVALLHDVFMGAQGTKYMKCTRSRNTWDTYYSSTLHQHVAVVHTSIYKLC